MTVIEGAGFNPLFIGSRFVTYKWSVVITYPLSVSIPYSSGLGL